ncbi:hypothetical protein F4782DRAFT_541766 [Xylaria castorea]|nr:hypothetical protein F4782DRAFT_541766 [Xylaria castorea]
MVNQRSRSGRSGFIRIALTDTDETEQRQLSGRARFRETVQQHNINPPSVQSSPALSDTSLTTEDYMNLTDAHGRYAEVLGYYGPEVVDNNDLAYDSYNTKAGKGLEVRIKSYPLDLSPDYSYRGSEGLIEKPLGDFSSLYNYRPVPLRWRFILIVFGGLVAFLALSELSLRFLPDASEMDEFLPAFQNISEIRKRSGHHDDGGDGGHFTGPNNDTQADTTLGVSLITVVSSSKEMSRITSTTSTIPTTSTTLTTSTIPTTSTSPTTSTTPATSTKETTSTAKTTSIIETTEITSTVKTSSTTETTSTTGTTPTTLTTEMISTISTISTTPNTQTISTTKTTEATEATETTKTTSTFEITSTTSTISTTETMEATSILETTSTTETIPTTEFGSPTEQHTANPTPNGPGPGDHPHSDEPISSTQTELEVTLTSDHGNPPIPSPSQYTTTLQQTVDIPPSPTVDSPHGTPNGQSPVITPSDSLPGLSAKPTSNSLLDPDPTNSPSPPGSNTAGPGKQDTDAHPSQSSSKPADVKSSNSLYQINGQSKAQPTDKGKGQPAGQPTSQAMDQANDDQVTDQPGNQSVGPSIDNTGVSPSSIHNVQPVVTSGQTFPTVDVMGTIGDKTDSLSASTQLPESPEQNLEENDKPFTTFTLTQTTETPPPPITTVFTTSSSVLGGGFVEVTMMTTIFGHIKAANPLTDYITTTTYGNGTVSTISKDVYDNVLTEIDFDAAGKPTGTRYIHVLNSAQVTILKNSLGVATATLDYYEVGSTITLYNSDNIATRTVTTTIPETRVWSTIYDISGRPIKTTILLRPILTNSEIAMPTPTSTSSPGSNNQRTLELHRLSDGIYFVGLMLPTLLTILLFILIRILNRNVKLYQGFHVLASDRGASAAKSLCLRTTGPRSLLDGLRSLQRGNYLLGLTSVLVVLSALAVPFSAEVFRLILQGPQCHLGESDGIKCSVTLGVYPAPAQVLSVLLIVLIVGIITVAVLLRRWKTGVEWDPWNILHMAQLAAGTDMRKVLERSRHGMHVDVKGLINRLHGKTLGLREWEENGAMKYSVLILTKEVEDLAEKPVNKAGRSVTFAKPKNVRGQRRLPVPFSILSLTGRIMFMFLLSGVLIAVLTYDTVARGSEYQRGLTGKAVGVRFLFSGAGIIVTFAWGSFFDAVAFLSPYKLLQRKRLNKGEAIAASPATNPFTGLWLAFVPSRRDLFLGVVAATAIVSEFLPLFLGNIPCNGVQLEIAETISVYLSVAVLSMMIFIVGGSFFIEWPTTMGVDPSTIAGAMSIAHVLSVAQPSKRFIKNEVVGIV